MRRFNYKARDSKTQKMVKGSIQAESERAAGKLLLERGFTPEFIEEEDTESIWAKLRSRVSTKDKVTFTRQFATLIGAGLPMSNSLRTVAEQTQNKAMRAIIEELLAEVEAGRTLGDACAKHPEIFDKVYLALIRAGETSGTLDESLKRLADQQEKDQEMMSDIRGALTYPAIVLLVIIAVMLFMLLAVLPQVENLYNDMGQPLPAMTKIMVAISNFILNAWWVVIVVIVLLVWFLMQFRKTETGQRWGALIKLNVPMFNSLFRRLYMSRFARTAQILLSTGVSMIDSINISAESMNNVVLQQILDEAAEKVKGGKPLSEALKDKDYILPLVPQMASIGEQSGKIDEMLGKAATVYENELDEQIRTLSKMIEPILMVVMALLVGFMIGAILLPIYSIVNSVQV